eukprot:CAMPEP_0116126544 /NCGR_PEP_ID=MMETSP0329-20121206/6385_1 /TAXON_ID=697910 /ORGANISM="Pseudo-nitzschia arenysensis, Strain B593" /LENGTH=1888 /DNA_ID=CAMNT_0003620627 /DNA_START=155 /DNA_END=5821 /DNA_ORIENTATION=-
MIDWKQRLYAFLLRRVLGPLLDASSAQKLHDSIDVSLQEGKFVLKNINLDATYLTDQLSDSCPGLRVRSGRIDRLEINLRLRENYHNNNDSVRAQSSLAWRAMKLGSMNESLPAVSLIAESKIDGIVLELETIDFKSRKSPQKLSTVDEIQTPEENSNEGENSSNNIIGSYIEAALATLQLNLKLTNIHVKFNHPLGSNDQQAWIGVKISSFSYSDLDVDSTRNTKEPMHSTIANKAIEFSEIIVEAGEISSIENTKQNRSVIAMAEGSGQIFLRILDCKPSESSTNKDNNFIQKDVEVRLNHRFNFSIDNPSLLIVQQVLFGFNTITEINAELDEVAIFRKSSMMKNPYLESTDLDREDLKALTGIMRQYREAYHMAEQKRLTGGILVPTNAYLDDAMCSEEMEDDTTFDMFFDANDQSLYNTTSILMESTRLLRDDQSPGNDLDHVHTKLRINLLSSCFKINFRQPDRRKHFSQAEEYILATLDDLSFSLFSTKRTSEVDLRITHFQVEDAYLAKRQQNIEHDNMLDAGAIKIGSILGWSEGDGYEEDTGLVSEAPCISVRVKTQRKSNKDEMIDCNMTLLPLELTFRQRTVENLTEFGNAAKDRFADFSRSPLSPEPAASDESARKDKEVSLCFECPSICLYLPLVEQIHMSPIYERCGETLSGAAIRETSIGAVFENTGIDFKLQQSKNSLPGTESISGNFWCLNMGLFVISPTSRSGFETRMLRKDIFIASGRTEVNPNIPISFGFKKGFSRTRDENSGRESFPIVPAISSFKARQEDDDESSSSSRNDLRGADPQITMLANSERSTVIFEVSFPEIVLDLTTKEIEVFLRTLKIIQKSQPRETDKVPARARTNDNSSDKLSVAINLDKVSLSVRSDQEISNGAEHRSKMYSFLLAMDKIKSHIFIEDSGMKHFRLFSQDLCLYSSCGEPITIRMDSRDRTLNGRFRILKKSLREFSDVLVVPILFRSQLFTPISQDTPSILLDLLDVSDANKKNALQQKRIYLTVYHLTFRYDADSTWIDRLSAMLPASKEEKEGTSTTDSSCEGVERSMTRLFISFADVNIDYKTPTYFDTRSKSIIRIGDFRVSSNIMKPAGLNQSYRLSVGDVTYHITSDMAENQYRNENSVLCRSQLVMKHEKLVGSRNASLFGTMPEAILRELNYVNVISLDALDAVVTKRMEDEVSKCDHSTDPIVAISLSVGTLYVHACKDSFSYFTKSIEELQSKLIGLTDSDIEALKGNPSDLAIATKPNRTKKQVCDASKPLDVPDLIRDTRIPKKSEDSTDMVLLDGHAWTTVDKDDLSPGLVIPPGDEQISGWYTSTDSGPGLSAPPSQIIYQHFPFHSFADPRSRGDMGARPMVGEKADLFLKSRISITKLNVKIRLLDGYDWPDKCSANQKEAVKRSGKTFVIEPSPDLERNNFEDAPDPRADVATKTRLMNELLGLDEDESETFFEEVPLPEERASSIDREKYLRMSRRRPNVFCQVSLNEVSLRMDSYQQSASHRLQSILEVSASNLFVAETVSTGRAMKMIGEWSNDSEHPRDTRYGTLMLNMATWAPAQKITEDNEIASEECSLSMQLMPMRCLLDQRAISFMKAFFNSDDANTDKTNGEERWSSKLHLPPPPTVKSLKIKPWKVKVDYYPSRVDVTALREGSIVELVNLSPIQWMIITLDEVTVLDSDGFGPAFSEIVSIWIKEICNTQLHKFLANARPFEPFTDVGQGLTDLIILPYEAFKQGDSIQRAMKNGVKSLAETVVFQTLATTSGLTKMAAGLMADSLGLTGRNDASDPLPSRPHSIPKGIGDARLHAAKSLARGVSAANYKVVIVPYREYLRNGMSGAVTSVIKGIPVLLVAPLSGATEAASYTLLGARNALRPDLRKEEEASVL